MADSLFNELVTPAPLRLDISALPRGIDNYHIDVKLSARFADDLKKLIAELLRQEASPQPQPRHSEKDLERLFVSLRQSYLDMMTVLIHRIKTDLSAAEIIFLQFAVPKHILQATAGALNEQINSAKLRASELRSTGSGEVLKVHQHLAWLSKHYSFILYRINRQIFEQINRVELRQLQSVRVQYLGADRLDISDFLMNPLLLNRDLNSSRFLVEHYVNWGGSAEENVFARLNQEIEQLMRELYPELDTPPLLAGESDPPLPTEVYDELGGLHAVRPFLGPALDSKNLLSEDFSWLDHPANPRRLFDLEARKAHGRELRAREGFKAWWQYRKQVKQTRAGLKRLAGLLERRKLLKPLLASYQVRKIWPKRVNREADPHLLCQYVSGQVELKRLTDPALGGKPLSGDELAALQEAVQELGRELKTSRLENCARILADLAEFRQHLKYFRLAHRLFNRLAILRAPEHIQLSRQAGTLYQMPTAAEVEQGQEKIVHHVILKADVRGSTTVTAQLEAMGLNAASHFSLRFFNPINELLPVYGAGKVFIEGDAIILSFLEYAERPQQWFAVAQACGLARAMLSIIHANNQHARQIGLPALELGIGICYADEAPRYLFDGDRPIMISSAIGKADRMSSSSWKLRDVVKPAPFNVEVLEIGEGERERGEKGQQYMRYNINGILLEEEAFAKLRGEVHLRRLNVRLDDKHVTLHYGEFPDMEGKKRPLLIREGRIGLWQGGHVTPGGPESRPFYEVVSNARILSMVQTGLGSKEAEAAG